ncbi:hypothetical protein RF11_16438 [Thelohanellus kitauei]|uniref:Uncharacterized protein n=1 Tax=Thelohanellus kitauei TaxID=669202 RepID=A0A0C2M286_THEKT|nr:hypothetical protein RF11_16438 [Thelohanellus kitauei]
MNLENESIAFEQRLCHCVTSIRQYLIIYGGRFVYYSINTCNELWIYDTINGICRKYPAPDRTRETNSDSSICTAGNKVYIFGSLGAPLADGTTYSLVSFDISNFSWQDLTLSIDDDDQQYSPPQMFQRLLFYHDEHLYVLGTIRGVTGEYFGSMYKFSLQTNIWFSVEQNEPKPVFFNQIIGTVFNNK